MEAGSSAMSIDVALSTHCGAAGIPLFTGVAAGLEHVLSDTSMDMPLLRGRSRHFPFLRILPFCVLRRRFAFRRVLLYICSANMDRASEGPFFSVLKGVILFGRLFFLSPKQ